MFISGRGVKLIDASIPPQQILQEQYTSIIMELIMNLFKSG